MKLQICISPNNTRPSDCIFRDADGGGSGNYMRFRFILLEKRHANLYRIQNFNLHLRVGTRLYLWGRGG